MTTDELLEHMSTVLWFNGVWNARARGSSGFVEAHTARGAMLLALGLTDEPVAAEPNADLF